MGKLPAFQFYPGDWWKEPTVQILNLEERGFWFQCLLLMHESEMRGKLILNGLPTPEDGLAMVMGVDKETVNQILTKLLTYGVASRCTETGAVMSRRMVRDEEIRKKRAIAGKLGGNPALLNQTVNHSDKQKPTPSSSSSSSSSDVPPKPPLRAENPADDPDPDALADTISFVLGIFGKKRKLGYEAEKSIGRQAEFLPLSAAQKALLTRFYRLPDDPKDIALRSRHGDADKLAINLFAALERAEAYEKKIGAAVFGPEKKEGAPISEPAGWREWFAKKYPRAVAPASWADVDGRQQLEFRAETEVGQ